MSLDKKKYIPLFHIIKKLKSPDDVSNIMDFLKDDAIDNICECVYNILNTDINLSPRKKSNLKKFLNSNCSLHRLNKISKKTLPISKRRKALKQEGKGLGMILASVLPFLANSFIPK